MSDWQSSILGKLSLRRKIAQMISARVLSNYVSEDSDSYQHIKRLVGDVGIGGITFFQGTVPGQAFYTNRLQELADIPLLVGQDAENGIGMRLTDATILPHMMAVGATGIPSAAYTACEIIATEANALGVHHVFAPVADVNTNPLNPIINTRSFGSDPALVTEFVVQGVRGLQDNGVLATVKHFPGHGDTSIDTHLNLATLEFDRPRLDAIELVPFIAAFKAGVRSCMVGHLSVPTIDPSGLPASLSRKIVTGLLREHLEYDGLVVTDAMDMHAITNTYGAGEAAVMAVSAGVDMLLLVADEIEAIDAIESAVAAGRIAERQIDASVSRILREKEWCGLNNISPVSMDNVFSVVANTDHLSTARSLAAMAICSMDDREDVDVLSNIEANVLISVVDDPTSTVGYLFEKTLGGRIQESHKIYPGQAADSIEATVTRAAEFDRIVVAVYLAVRSYSGRISFPPEVLSAINELAAYSHSIVVLFGSPYLYSQLESDSMCIATCSTSPASEEAVAALLLDGGSCRGTLPVDL